MRGIWLNTDLHPYVVFLPSDQKARLLSAIFGSKAAVDILKFSLEQGISSKIYQKDLVEKLDYSNKTVIGNLKSLTNLGILTESMEKAHKNKRITWVKAYHLSDAGRWFALLIAKESDLSNGEKVEILQSLFRSYIQWVKDLSQKLQLDRKVLESAFAEEMSAGERV
jgi:hypothetical protein